MIRKRGSVQEPSGDSRESASANRFARIGPSKSVKSCYLEPPILQPITVAAICSDSFPREKNSCIECLDWSGGEDGALQNGHQTTTIRDDNNS